MRGKTKRQMRYLFTRINKASTPNQIADEIKAAIQSGRLKTGDRLPNEKELSEFFGVGRSTVREGIKLLAAYGVVDVRQGDGTFVCDVFSNTPYENLSYIPVRENMLHLQRFRRILECGVIQLICMNITSEDCDALDVLTEKLIDTNSTVADRTKADLQFHSKLVHLSGNPLIKRVYEMTTTMLSSLMTDLMSHQDDVVEDAYQSHKNIVEALRGRRLRSSVASMNSHMENVEKYIKKYIN